MLVYGNYYALPIELEHKIYLAIKAFNMGYKAAGEKKVTVKWVRGVHDICFVYRIYILC